MRAARTDKGVSAIGQVVSLKMVVGFAEYDVISNINKHLPDQVRVLGYTKTTAGFDARKHCDKRRYEYILPVWAFDPTSCRGRIDVEEAELASASKPNAADEVLPQGLVDCQTGAIAAKEAITEATAAVVASEAVLRDPSAYSPSLQAGDQQAATAKVDLPEPNPSAALQQAMASDSSTIPYHSDQTPATAPAHQSNSASNTDPSGQVANGPAPATDQSGQAANGPAPATDPSGQVADGPVPATDQSGQAANGPDTASISQDASPLLASNSPGPTSDTHQPSTSDFAFDDAAVRKLSAILRQYEGTHNFHNFTVRLEASDPSAKRYMLSCKCTGIFDIQVALLYLFCLKHLSFGHVTSKDLVAESKSQYIALIAQYVFCPNQYSALSRAQHLPVMVSFQSQGIFLQIIGTVLPPGRNSCCCLQICIHAGLCCRHCLLSLLPLLMLADDHRTVVMMDQTIQLIVAVM